MRMQVLAVAGAAMLGGCATLLPDREPAGELVGETVRLETDRGRVSTLDFRRDGVVVARFGDNQAAGRWRVEGESICFYWTGAPRECWPYRERFRRGVPVDIVSTRGNRVEVTLL